MKAPEMKIQEEDISKIMVNDLPQQSEYSHVIYAAYDAGRLVSSDFKKSLEASDRAWTGITNLMAYCIARGMRLERDTMKKEDK